MDLQSLQCVRVERGPVARLVVSRPKALNALNRQVLNELIFALTALAEASDRPRCLIITGDGEKSFVAGADIAEMNGLDGVEAEAFGRLGHRVMNLIENFPSPVLAAVNGFALGGGCELALACDIIYASENAKFGQPEVKLGLIPGFGGSVRLPRKIGLAAASEWIFTGEVYTAQQAEKVGLVRAIFAAGELHAKVQEVAQRIAKRAPLAVRVAKQVMVRGLATDGATALSMELSTFGQLFGSKDMREGTQAFIEKREPSFKGE